MEETPKETADKGEMEIHVPSYPLPLEIQQMDHSDKTCRYCGVSYLILHEFQRLQERLREVERELEQERGSTERERTLREKLQEAYAHLEELKTSVLQQQETTKALDLQLCVVTREMESVRVEKKTAFVELENERTCRLHLRSRFVHQQRLLGEALALLHSSRGEMTTVKKQLTHFLETWENSKALIQQSCISADAEGAHLKQQVAGLQVELKRLQVEVPNLKSCLDAAKEQILQLENQVQTQNREAQLLTQGLREEVKTLKIDIQNSRHEREHAEKLLEMKSAEKEGLRALWSGQTDAVESEELRRSHAGELERLEESFRTRLNAAEEHNSEMEDFLRQKQAEQDKQLKQQEMELRREADIELDIQRQQNQELMNKYQSEKQQLQNRIPALVHSATQELREELAVLQERIEDHEKEMRRVCESASQRQRELTEERRTGEAQLNQAQSNVQRLKEERAALQEEKCFLEETVRRECEEREELTSALSLAKEQLLELKRSIIRPKETQTHTQLSRLTGTHTDLPFPKFNPSPPSRSQAHKNSSRSTLSTSRFPERNSGSGSKSSTSWHGSSLPSPTLPKISKERMT
ncbi:leucine-, glutamate- and lysine-rich protein 1 isoform X3 [Puntigrus tetrazona]|uniref:leucine-, glutamate- and lysine-rich protein 1 isoform X3 n=1 Tax=Puntigrus tetrazona TaxID=1606681 RepID=UPI001C89F4FB|nr:leucine-, glutamate- and lysine-rich protein 1 isoform X3 [Puntigrus tetrazona]